MSASCSPTREHAASTVLLRTNPPPPPQHHGGPKPTDCPSPSKRPSPSLAHLGRCRGGLSGRAVDRPAGRAVPGGPARGLLGPTPTKSRRCPSRHCARTASLSPRALSRCLCLCVCVSAAFPSDLDHVSSQPSSQAAHAAPNWTNWTNWRGQLVCSSLSVQHALVLATDHQPPPRTRQWPGLCAGESRSGHRGLSVLYCASPSRLAHDRRRCPRDSGQATATTTRLLERGDGNGQHGLF